jgi:SAM-dependent methyltransferase
VSDGGKDRVRGFFTAHARNYAVDPGQRAGPDLVRLLERLEILPTDRALDVGTAAGNTAAALAPRVASVVGLDLTPRMRGEFEAVMRSARVENVGFEVGDADALPFPDGSFDLVTCRRAMHHFPSPSRAMAEMVRVLRPGGRAGFADMAAPANPGGAALFNALEQARDASHARALSPGEWRRLVEGAGLEVATLDELPDRIPWERWLSPVKAGGPEDALARERVAAASDAARAEVVERDGGDLVIRKVRVVVTARKPG